MKKLVYFCFALAVIGMMNVSCSSCQKDKDQQGSFSGSDYDGVIQDFTAGISHIQSLHRQKMFFEVSKSYEWRNSKIIFNDSLSLDNLDDVKVVDVTDVFQYWDNGPHVQFITSNVKDGTFMPAPIPDIWIEDASLNDAPVKLSAEEALKRLKEWNGIIPPVKGMSLRLPIGPRRCNAQWVLGDVFSVIFIDAVTGEITNWNPAFPNPSVKGPLGEWP